MFHSVHNKEKSPGMSESERDVSAAVEQHHRTEHSAFQKLCENDQVERGNNKPVSPLQAKTHHQRQTSL